MKSSASESTRNACFNLERLSRSFRRSFYGPRASRLGHKSMEKNSVRNLQYGPKTRLIRGMYSVSSLNEMGIFRLLNLV